jgi:hypothetical protein
MISPEAEVASTSAKVEVLRKPKFAAKLEFLKF